MNYYVFYRESNKFDDLLNDVNLKKLITLKMSWYQHLVIGFNDLSDDIRGYIILKYGDELTKLTEKDYSPIINVDYVPKRNV